MATKRGFAGERWISKIEEATYRASTTLDALLYSNAGPLRIVQEHRDTTEMAVISSEESEDITQLSRMAEGDEDLPRLRPQEAAIYLSYTLGNVNQSPANEPASGYYTHTITTRPVTFLTSAQDGSGSPITTLEVEDTGSWPSTGSLVNQATGTAWAYTGKTATTFTGVSITDNMADNQAVNLLEPTRDYTLPSFNMINYTGGVEQRRNFGCFMQRFEIRGERKGFVQASGHILSSGSQNVATESPPAAISEVYLKTGDCAIHQGGTWNGTAWTGGTAIRTDVRSYRWACENEIPDDLIFTMGAGLFIGRPERLRRRQTLELEMEFDDHTELNWLLNQTALNLQINMAGPTGSYACKLIFPAIKIIEATPSGGVGVLVYNLTAAVQEEATYGSVFAQVINQQIDYLHV